MTNQRTYTVTGMDCANCAATLQDGIRRLDGVNAVRVDFIAGKIHITGDTPLTALQARAGALGGYSILADNDTPAPTTASGVMGFARYLLSEHTTRFALGGGLLTVLTLTLALVGLPGPVAFGGYLLGTAVAAYPIARSGLNNLLLNRRLNLNLLMTVAALGAVIIGEAVEAAVVVLFYAIGEALEGYTADRARRSIRALADLTPDEAHLLRDGHTQTVAVAALTPGDTILVKPGERVPMDGDVIGGAGGVNQAPITGESLPVHKAPGDAVYAGSVNGDGALTVRVTAHAADNTLSRVVQLVEEAQSARSPSQRRIDEFAAYYTPLMAAAALLIAIVPPLAFGAPFFEPATGGHGWLYRALAMLMIACPCSLVISTPVTVVSAITSAARRGVLVKGGRHLEALGRVRAIAFDKTGTLTHGTPQVTGYHATGCTAPANCSDCDEMLTLAASVEGHSAHPLARAITSAARHTYPAHDVVSLGGRGVQGQVNGQAITVGSHRLFEEQFPHSPAVCEAVAAHERNGQTAMLVAAGADVRGIIAVADTVREGTRAVLDDLNALGVATIMLTGDNATVAAAVGERVGVGEVRAGLLPGDKSGAVDELTGRYGRVAMVGDGINDTPALAAASVGVAMGGAGSAAAIETADIVLMGDDLRQLPRTVRLSRFAVRLINQNIALSIGIKLIFTVLAVGGLTSLWLAIFADVGMLVVVTLNGMRPLRFR